MKLEQKERLDLYEKVIEEEYKFGIIVLGAHTDKALACVYNGTPMIKDEDDE